jgi:septal ring factor EnvC (AmiA/AmiB activator)
MHPSTSSAASPSTTSLSHTPPQVQAGEEMVSKLEAQLRESRQHADKLTKELNLLTDKEAKLHEEIKDKVSENSKLMQTNSVKQMELKQREDEIAAVGSGKTVMRCCAMLSRGILAYSMLCTL